MSHTAPAAELERMSLALARVVAAADRVRSAIESLPPGPARDLAATLLPGVEVILEQASAGLGQGGEAVAARGRPGLTDRQARILQFILDHRGEHGYSPTVREIGLETGIRSPNAVHGQLKRLAKKGYLRLDANTARALVPIP